MQQVNPTITMSTRFDNVVPTSLGVALVVQWRTIGEVVTGEYFKPEVIIRDKFFLKSCES